MTTQQFPFITDGIRGDVPINFYPAADSERGVILFGTSGLLSHCQLTDCTEVRGLTKFGAYLYAVAKRGGQSVVWRVDSGGGFSEIGSFATSSAGPVWMTNNATQLLIVDGVTGYVYDPSGGGVVLIADADFPGASSADYQDGYGLFSEPASNQWFFSDQFDFTAFDPLDFYTKESRPDNIVSLISHMREIFIFGETATEVWYNAGGDNSSVYNPTFKQNTGGLIAYGCGAAASPSTFDGEAVIWLSDKGQIIQAVGYAGKIVSNQMFSRAIKGFTSFSNAIAFSYRDEGHIFYQITFPSANQTWVLDGTTQMWFKKTSYKDDLSGYGRHRANCYARLGNQHYVGDYSNGRIYKMSTNYYDDNGEEIQRILYSKEMETGMRKMSFPSVQIVVESGVGTIGGIDPQIMLQFSGDGGHTWSNEAWRSAGLIGEYGRRAIWHRQGSGFRRMYRATFTDPVLWRVLAVDIEDPV